eukprot:scaffold39069_cov154-Skeletonema_marinoi.AAC.16
MNPSSPAANPSYQGNLLFSSVRVVGVTCSVAYSSYQSFQFQFDAAAIPSDLLAVEFLRGCDYEFAFDLCLVLPSAPHTSCLQLAKEG